MRISRRLTLGLVTLLLGSCRESFNPTDPDAQLMVMVTIENVDGARTLSETAVTVDGHEMARHVSQDPLVSHFLMGFQTGRFSGDHILDVVIVRQVSSPNPYRVVPTVTLDSGTRGNYGVSVSQAAEVAPQTVPVETGGAVHFTFHY